MLRCVLTGLLSHSFSWSSARWPGSLRTQFLCCRLCPCGVVWEVEGGQFVSKNKTGKPVAAAAQPGSKITPVLFLLEFLKSDCNKWFICFHLYNTYYSLDHIIFHFSYFSLFFSVLIIILESISCMEFFGLRNVLNLIFDMLINFVTLELKFPQSNFFIQCKILYL